MTTAELAGMEVFSLIATEPLATACLALPGMRRTFVAVMMVLWCGRGQRDEPQQEESPGVPPEGKFEGGSVRRTSDGRLQFALILRLSGQQFLVR